MKSYSLDELTDEYIGQQGTKERDVFDEELKAAQKLKTAYQMQD